MATRSPSTWKITGTEIWMTFIVWNENLERVREFQNLINVLDVNIQFPMEYGYQQLPCHIILINISNNVIEKDIYYKLTDS